MVFSFETVVLLDFCCLDVFRCVQAKNLKNEDDGVDRMEITDDDAAFFTGWELGVVGRNFLHWCKRSVPKGSSLEIAIKVVKWSSESGLTRGFLNVFDIIWPQGFCRVAFGFPGCLSALRHFLARQRWKDRREDLQGLWWKTWKGQNGVRLFYFSTYSEPILHADISDDHKQ